MSLREKNDDQTNDESYGHGDSTHKKSLCGKCDGDGSFLVPFQSMYKHTNLMDYFCK